LQQYKTGVHKFGLEKNEPVGFVLQQYETGVHRFGLEKNEPVGFVLQQYETGVHRFGLEKNEPVGFVLQQYETGVHKFGLEKKGSSEVHLIGFQLTTPKTNFKHFFRCRKLKIHCMVAMFSII